MIRLGDLAPGDGTVFAYAHALESGHDPDPWQELISHDPARGCFELIYLAGSGSYLDYSPGLADIPVVLREEVAR